VLELKFLQVREMNSNSIYENIKRHLDAHSGSLLSRPCLSNPSKMPPEVEDEGIKVTLSEKSSH